MPGKYDNVLAALKKAKAELPAVHLISDPPDWCLHKTDVKKARCAVTRLYESLRHVKPNGAATAVIAEVTHLSRTFYPWEMTICGDFRLISSDYARFVNESLNAWINLYEEANHAE